MSTVSSFTSKDKEAHREYIAEHAKIVDGIIYYTEAPDVACTTAWLGYDIPNIRLCPINNDKHTVDIMNDQLRESGVIARHMDIFNIPDISGVAIIWLDMTCLTTKITGAVVEGMSAKLVDGGMLAISASTRCVPGNAGSHASDLAKKMSTKGLKVVDNFGAYKGISNKTNMIFQCGVKGVVESTSVVSTPIRPTAPRKPPSSIVKAGDTIFGIAPTLWESPAFSGLRKAWSTGKKTLIRGAVSIQLTVPAFGKRDKSTWHVSTNAKGEYIFKQGGPIVVQQTVCGEEKFKKIYDYSKDEIEMTVTDIYEDGFEAKPVKYHQKYERGYASRWYFKYSNKGKGKYGAWWKSEIACEEEYLDDDTLSATTTEHDSLVVSQIDEAVKRIQCELEPSNRRLNRDFSFTVGNIGLRLKDRRTKFWLYDAGGNIIATRKDTVALRKAIASLVVDDVEEPPSKKLKPTPKTDGEDEEGDDDEEECDADVPIPPVGVSVRARGRLDPPLDKDEVAKLAAILGGDRSSLPELLRIHESAKLYIEEKNGGAALRLTITGHDPCDVEASNAVAEIQTAIRIATTEFATHTVSVSKDGAFEVEDGMVYTAADYDTLWMVEIPEVGASLDIAVEDAWVATTVDSAAEKTFMVCVNGKNMRLKSSDYGVKWQHATTTEVDKTECGVCKHHLRRMAARIGYLEVCYRKLAANTQKK
jgi:hypothetical protein